MKCDRLVTLGPEAVCTQCGLEICHESLVNSLPQPACEGAEAFRRFYIYRDFQGTVAEGVIFHDGTVTLRWLTKTPSTGIYPSLHHFRAIHQHADTQIRWLDSVCPQCGSDTEGYTFHHCNQCGAMAGVPLAIKEAARQAKQDEAEDVYKNDFKNEAAHEYRRAWGMYRTDRREVESRIQTDLAV